jgi:hypothetical protein
MPGQNLTGGVTRTTNEAILLCEAAGFNIVIGRHSHGLFSFKVLSSGLKINKMALSG